MFVSTFNPSSKDVNTIFSKLRQRIIDTSEFPEGLEYLEVKLPKDIEGFFQNVESSLTTGNDDDDDQNKEKYLTAQQQSELIQLIDNFMHRKDWDYYYMDVSFLILESCPEILTVKDENGKIPMQNLVENKKWDPKNQLHCYYFEILLQFGTKSGVFPTDRKGGLLGEDYNFIPVLMQELIDDNDYFFLNGDRYFSKKLPKYCPQKKLCWNEEFMNTIVDLDPSILYRVSPRFGTIPLFDQLVDLSKEDYSNRQPYADKNSKYLLRKAIEHDPTHHTIGGLFSYNRPWIGMSKEPKLLLNQMLYLLHEDLTWNIIEKALSSCSHRADIPILHQIIDKCPSQILNAMTRFPDAVFLRDAEGRLPVHVALAKGLQWSNPGFVPILLTSMEHLKHIDPVTGFYPFGLAAMEPSCDLRTIMYLLQLNPIHPYDPVIHTRNSCDRRKRPRLHH